MILLSTVGISMRIILYGTNFNLRNHGVNKKKTLVPEKLFRSKQDNCGNLNLEFSQ